MYQVIAHAYNVAGHTLVPFVEPTVTNVKSSSVVSAHLRTCIKRVTMVLEFVSTKQFFNSKYKLKCSTMSQQGGQTGGNTGGQGGNNDGRGRDDDRDRGRRSNAPSPSPTRGRENNDRDRPPLREVSGNRQKKNRDN